MAGEPQVVLVGGLTADPELRFTQSGLAVANFTIAQTPRSFDRQKNEYVDGEALFIRCSVWRDYAEHIAASLQKGMQVIAVGRLVSRSYETKEGEKRTSMELQVDDIGPTLRFATAQVIRTGSRTQTNNQAQQRGQQQEQQWYAPGQGAPQQVQPAQQQPQWQGPPAGQSQEQPVQQQPQQFPGQVQGVQAGDFAPMYQQQPAQQVVQGADPGLWQAPTGQEPVDPNAPF